MVSPQAVPDGHRDGSNPRAECAAGAGARMGCAGSSLGRCDSPVVRDWVRIATGSRFPKLAEFEAAFVLDYDPVPHGGRCPDRRGYFIPRPELGVDVALEGLSESAQSTRQRRPVFHGDSAPPLCLDQRSVGGSLLDCPHQGSFQPMAPLSTTL